jgi:sialate O-acetylesterase
MKTNLKFFVAVVMTVSMMQADVRLPAIFGSNMVLQRDQQIPVWGFSSPRESVTVVFNGAVKRTVGDENGRWSVVLDAMSDGGPFDMTVSGTNSIELRNILIGEVWICSGQSNMTMELKKTTGADEVIAASANPRLRLFTVKRVLSDTLLNDVQGTWEECSPEVSGDFSAVAYFFGKNLYDSLQVPIGLVHVSWGGTAAEGWMPRDVLESDPDFAPIIQRWVRDSTAYPEAIKEFNEKLPALSAQWIKDSAAAVSLGRSLPRKPTAPRGPGHRDTPCGQYNGMLHPIIPFAMRGVIWYQGEGNASRAHQYRRLFPALITTWRTLWKQGEFPFYFVQLPNLNRQPEPSKSGWAELREAQMLTLALPNTGMAVTIDVGDPKDLHPANKRPVGERLAYIALAKTYGKPIPYAAPIVQQVNFSGASATVRFEKTKDGLTTRDGKKLLGFTLAGNDKKFYPAQGVLKGNEVIVSSPFVKRPESVRYAWADDPNGNLCTRSGLPVAPFRSDEWPEITVGKK